MASLSGASVELQFATIVPFHLFIGSLALLLSRILHRPRLGRCQWSLGLTFDSPVIGDDLQFADNYEIPIINPARR